MTVVTIEKTNGVCYHMSALGGYDREAVCRCLSPAAAVMVEARRGGAVVRFSEMYKCVLCVCVEHISPAIVCFLAATHMTVTACFHAVSLVLSLMHAQKCAICYCFH